jgi:hypothetical protein
MSFINGPVNVMRLEGKVGKIKKVLYVYFDIHNDINKQSKCENIRAENITSHFVKNFDEIHKLNDKYVDFFLETYPMLSVFKESTRDEFKYTDIYLRNLRELFKQSFTYNIEKKKIYTSAEFPHTRLHYIDIRDLFIYDIMFLSLPNMIAYFNKYCWNGHYIIKQDISYFINELNKINEKIMSVQQLFSDGNETTSNKEKKQDKTQDKKKTKKREKMEISLSKIINKIKNTYKNNDIKSKINEYSYKTLHESFNSYNNTYTTIIKYLNEIDTYINTIEKNNITRINTETEMINNFEKIYLPQLSILFREYERYLWDIGCYMIDIYFLRRYLDKDYITNGIIYTGAHHSMNYVYFLIKYMDFKLTHYSHLGCSLTEIHKLIKNSNSFDEVYTQLLPQYFQCSNIASFPKYFD